MESKNLFIARRLKTLTKDDLPWNKTEVFFAYFPKYSIKWQEKAMTVAAKNKKSRTCRPAFTVHKLAFTASAHLSASIQWH